MKKERKKKEKTRMGLFCFLSLKKVLWTLLYSSSFLSKLTKTKKQKNATYALDVKKCNTILIIHSKLKTTLISGFVLWHIQGYADRLGVIVKVMVYSTLTSLFCKCFQMNKIIIPNKQTNKTCKLFIWNYNFC